MNLTSRRLLNIHFQKYNSLKFIKSYLHYFNGGLDPRQKTSAEEI